MRPPLPIARISPPSVEEFYRVHVRGSRPAILTGLVDDWPALRRWSLDYFDRQFGEVNAAAYPLKGGECDVSVNRGSALDNIPVRDSVASVARGLVDGGLALASLVDVFPDALRDDYASPAYCANGKFPSSRLFIGPAGTLSPLHQDLPENLYVLVKGRKRLTLFAPRDYVYPLRFSKMPNHAHVDPEKPDYERCPKFRDAQPYVVELVAGETLFIPSLWWHHLRNLEPSMALNFWWSTGWKLPIAWAMAMTKKVMQMRPSRVGARRSTAEATA